jgi:segregation and condensation protein B
MSLKAKLEAVIYAAEEPVTLSQLTSLFAAEALEWKAEQEAAAAEAASAALPTSETLPDSLIDQLEVEGLDAASATLIAESVAPGESAEESTAQAAETTSEPAAEPIAEAANGTIAVPVAESSEPATETAEPAAEDASAAPEGAPAVALAAGTAGVPETPEDGESELKRQARQREREARAVIRQLLEEIVATYVSDGRGIEIREIAGGFRMATKPECHDAVRLFVKSLKPPLKLSLAALETLAVIAYKQPVTAPEVNEIRGVESAGVLGSLLARKLIATAGRKQVIGRPILYKTTKEFLLRFGLKNVGELPSMEEFEKMAAIELEEPEESARESADLNDATEEQLIDIDQDAENGDEAALETKTEEEVPTEEQPIEIDQEVENGDEAALESKASEEVPFEDAEEPAPAAEATSEDPSVPAE